MAFFNDSKFHMWRGCVAAVWADGVVSSEEREWVLKKIEGLPFTPEQKETLLKDLEGRGDFAEIVSKITDKKDRAFLAHQIRVIGNLDKNYSEEEKKLFSAWHDSVMKGVDLSELEKIVAEDEKLSYHEDEVYKAHNKTSIFERTFRSVQKFLNPGDYKFPDDDK